MFPDAVHTSSKQIIPIDQQTGLAQLPVGVSLPTRPFFGILGVAPPPSLGRIDSTAPGCHGGNIDNKELVAGTTLFLPVWVEGALFSAGDGHAAQGDGEVDITAIETCLEGDFRFKVRNDISLTLPIAVTPTHIVTMGFHEDLDRAAEIAVRSLLDLLERYCHLQPLDSYRLASIAVDLRVTQVVNGLKGIHTMLARSLWDQLGSVIDFAATA
jgi:acetamidase/formamidase